MLFYEFCEHFAKIAANDFFYERRDVFCILAHFISLISFISKWNHRGVYFFNLELDFFFFPYQWFQEIYFNLG